MNERGMAPQISGVGEIANLLLKKREAVVSGTVRLECLLRDDLISRNIQTVYTTFKKTSENMRSLWMRNFNLR